MCISIVQITIKGKMDIVENTIYRAKTKDEAIDRIKNKLCTKFLQCSEYFRALIESYNIPFILTKCLSQTILILGVFEN